MFWWPGLLLFTDHFNARDPCTGRVGRRLCVDPCSQQRAVGRGFVHVGGKTVEWFGGECASLWLCTDPFPQSLIRNRYGLFLCLKPVPPPVLKHLYFKVIIPFQTGHSPHDGHDAPLTSIVTLTRGDKTPELSEYQGLPIKCWREVRSLEGGDINNHEGRRSE